MKFFLFLLVLLLLPGLVYGQPQPVTLSQTGEYSLYSAHVKDTFYLQISLPSNYQEQKTSLPIIYLLDSDRSFGMTKGIVEWLQFEKLIPDLILVGIAYKKNWWQNRSRDYTPTHDSKKNWGDWPLAGGADKFLRFVDEELNTKLKDYRIDWTSRTIIGHSFGGILATYALFQKPWLFDHYLSISPALIWDDKYLFGLDPGLLRSVERPKSVYTAIGELDKANITEPWKEMNQHIAAQDLPGLEWMPRAYSDQGHSSVLPVAITDGLKAVFNRK